MDRRRLMFGIGGAVVFATIVAARPAVKSFMKDMDESNRRDEMRESQDRAQQFVESLGYVQDPRTHLCFAVSRIVGQYSTGGFAPTGVSCTPEVLELAKRGIPR